MKTTKEKIEIMQSYENGCTIETRLETGGAWVIVDNPLWNWASFDYRIKKQTEIYTPMELFEAGATHIQIDNRIFAIKTFGNIAVETTHHSWEPKEYYEHGYKWTADRKTWHSFKK